MGKVGSRVRNRAWLRGSLLLGVLCLALVSYWQIGQGVGGNAVYGPYGPEGPRLREQLWIVPGSDRNVPLRATLFRPPENVPTAPAHAAFRRPLVVINHGSDEATREAVSMPVFYWLSKWFVDKGYVVLLPQRRGHGATGGELAEGKDTCARPHHRDAGAAAADDIEAALSYMAGQRFIDASRVIVAGVSTGGWASLALASRNPVGVQLVINFAGGRGGHAYGQPNKVCGADRLIEAVGTFGRTAKVPTLWVYSANDSYFGPDIAEAMVHAWQKSGGLAELLMLPAFGAEGHDIVGAPAGWRIWGHDVEASLERHAGARRPRLSASR